MTADVKAANPAFTLFKQPQKWGHIRLFRAFAPCEPVRIPGVSLTHTSSQGFVGADTLTVDSLEAGDQSQSMRVEMAAK